MASETQEEATDSKAASAPALCHTSRLLENRNTSQILPPWSDDNGEPRQSTEVRDSGQSASWRTSVGLGKSLGYEERQPHAHVGQSTMDVSRLFLPELRVARFFTVAIAPSALGDVATVAVAVLQGSRLSERLSGITSRRSAKGCAAATLSARKRWQSRIRVQPRPRSKTV